MNNSQKGTNYEKFVQSIYQTLHDAEGIKNVQIEQNKTDLIGRSGCTHQIDVYWEFKAAGQTYKTAIECKAFDEPVSIGRVRDFLGLLTDYPDLIGILVSPCGFQKGAKRFARYYGINLKEVRFPNEADWEGRIKNLHLEVGVVSPIVKDFHLIVEDDFLMSLKQGESIQGTFSGKSDSTLIVDRNRKRRASYDDLLHELPLGNEAINDKTHTVQLPDCFWQGDDGNLIPIKGVCFKYDVSVEKQTFDLLGEYVAEAIMKDVYTGELLFFDTKGGVHNFQS